MSSMVNSCITDTATVALDVSDSGALSADLVLDPRIENLAEVTADGLYVPSSGVSVPTGTVVRWGGTKAGVPAGYLPCDGREVDRVSYRTLFERIGTLWGDGDAVSTFNLPPPPEPDQLVGYSAREGTITVPLTATNFDTSEQILDDVFPKIAFNDDTRLKFVFLAPLRLGAVTEGHVAISRNGGGIGEVAIFRTNTEDETFTLYAEAYDQPGPGSFTYGVRAWGPGVAYNIGGLGNRGPMFLKVYVAMLQIIKT